MSGGAIDGGQPLGGPGPRFGARAAAIHVMEGLRDGSIVLVRPAPPRYHGEVHRRTYLVKYRPRRGRASQAALLVVWFVCISALTLAALWLGVRL